MAERAGRNPASLSRPAAYELLFLWVVNWPVDNVRNNFARLLDRVADAHAELPSDALPASIRDILSSFMRIGYCVLRIACLSCKTSEPIPEANELALHNCGKYAHQRANNAK